MTNPVISFPQLAHKQPRQKHTAWIRTGNLSLIKHNALTTEPQLQIRHIMIRTIAVYVVELQKTKLQSTKHAGTGCFCLSTLALISTLKMWLGDINEMCLQGLNLSSTQKSAFHHELALLQPAMNVVGLCSSIKWKLNLSGRIGWPQVKRFQYQDGVRKAYEMIAKHALLFELCFCDVRIAPVTKHLLVQANNFFNPSGLLNYFYAQCA